MAPARQHQRAIHQLGHAVQNVRWYGPARHRKTVCPTGGNVQLSPRVGPAIGHEIGLASGGTVSGQHYRQHYIVHMNQRATVTRFGQRRKPTALRGFDQPR